MPTCQAVINANPGTFRLLLGGVILIAAGAPMTYFGVVRTTITSISVYILIGPVALLLAVIFLLAGSILCCDAFDKCKCCYTSSRQNPGQNQVEPIQPSSLPSASPDLQKPPVYGKDPPPYSHGSPPHYTATRKTIP